MKRRTTPLAREGRLVMIRRLLAALALAALAASPTLAGGHVDIKASAFPQSIEAGRSMDIAFTITYPNGEPVMDAKPVVRLSSGRRTLVVPARAAKAEGGYVASVRVPRAGNWA